MYFDKLSNLDTKHKYNEFQKNKKIFILCEFFVLFILNFSITF